MNVALTADAIDRPLPWPQKSARAVFALASDPALRALPSDELARRLGTSRAEAERAIGAFVGELTGSPVDQVAGRSFDEMIATASHARRPAYSPEPVQEAAGFADPAPVPNYRFTHTPPGRSLLHVGVMVPEMPAGWTPPPRPIYLSPSYDPNDSPEMSAWKSLVDWAHDDDLVNWITQQLSPPRSFRDALAGTNLQVFPTDALIAFYFLGRRPAPLAIAEFATKYGYFVGYYDRNEVDGASQTVSFGGAQYQIPTVLPSAWETMWLSLDHLLKKTVLPKRAALGSLPANVLLNPDGSLASPMIIYYYDDVWLKRVKYPLGLVPTASMQDRWWNVGVGNLTVQREVFATAATDWLGNRGPTDSADPTGVWVGEGWDIEQGSGAMFDIMHAVVAVAGLVLSATGVGAVLSAVIVGIANVAIGLAQAVTDSINGGNPGAAILSIGEAVLAVGSSELGKLQVSAPSIAKLGKGGLAELGVLLKQIGTDLTPTHTTASFSDQLAKLTANAPNYATIMDRDGFEALLQTISGNGGIAIPPAQAGWDLAQYATHDELVAIGKIYEQSFPAPTTALWKMGVQLGMVARAQYGTFRGDLSPLMRKILGTYAFGRKSSAMLASTHEVYLRTHRPPSPLPPLPLVIVGAVGVAWYFGLLKTVLPKGLL